MSNGDYLGDFMMGAAMGAAATAAATPSFNRREPDLRGEVARLREELKRKNEIIEIQHDQIDSRDDVIAGYEKKMELQRLAIEARDEKAALLEKRSQEHLDYRNYLEKQLNVILDTCGAASANVAVYEKLYKMLVDEINEVDNPERFNSLNPTVRHQAMKEVWQTFRKTAQVIYHPDLSIFEKESELDKELNAAPKAAAPAPAPAPAPDISLNIRNDF